MISGDWPAFTRRIFERAEPGVHCVFLNGAQGDVNHVCTDPRPGEREGLHPDFDDVDRGYEHARHMGRVVAAAALSVWGKCEPVAAGPLRFGVRTISVPAQRPTADDLPKAREYVRLHREGRDAEIPFTGMALTTVVAEAERILAAGKRLKSSKEDLHSMVDESFHKTLLSLPLTGIIIFSSFDGAHPLITKLERALLNEYLRQSGFEKKDTQKRKAVKNMAAL